MARWIVGMLVVGVASGLATPASARRLGGTAMQRLELRGYVGNPPEGRREEAELELSCDGATRRFQVTRGRVLSGDMMIAHVFDRLRPYKPSLFLRGPKDLVSRCVDAKPGDRLVIQGGWRPGSRDLLLSGIEPGTAE
jgi:hypothetical protein